jgi:lipopolysaccharide export system permease protein
MRLHDRYLFRELLTPLAYCLGGFLVFWISFFFFREMETIQEKKLNLSDTAEFCAASLPEFFVLVLPILLLLALLYALTHHARHNEITALRAAGVGLWRLCAPYFIVGLVATGIYFALNEVAVPRCDRWSKEILSRHVKKENAPKNKTRFTKHNYDNVRGHRSWIFFGDYDAVNNSMISPTVTWTWPDGSLRVLLQAGRAVRTNGVWTFFNAQLLKQAGQHGELVPTVSTNVLAMPEFDETPERILLLLKFSDTQDWRDLRSADIPLAGLWEYSRNNSGIPAEKTRALLTEFYGRIAAPWTCLVVVLMAIPFGAQSGRRNLFFGVTGSIFICFAYFVLQRVSLAFGMNGHLPGWLAAWLPNLVFAGVGIILTLRVR